MFCLATSVELNCFRGDRFCCASRNNGHFRQGRHGLWGWWTSCSHQLYWLNGTGCFCCFIRNWHFFRKYMNMKNFWDDNGGAAALATLAAFLPGGIFLTFWCFEYQIRKSNTFRYCTSLIGCYTSMDLVLRYYNTFLKSDIDTQNDAMFEAGDTFFRTGYVEFRGCISSMFFFAIS